GWMVRAVEMLLLERNRRRSLYIRIFDCNSATPLLKAKCTSSKAK
ncbi:hypothetical protein Tco_0562848, partial [Tanacetum coccineum]